MCTPFTASIAVGAVRAPLPLGHLTAGLRAFLVAPRPIPLGFQSRWSGSATLQAGWEVGKIAVGLFVENLLGIRSRSGEFVYASWWDRDNSRSELPALHLTAGSPPSARLSLEVRW